MRSTVLYGAVALALAAGSCTVTDISPDGPSDGAKTVEMSFGATILSDETKTLLDDYDTASGKYPILWSPDDSINVFDVNASPNQTAKLRNQADTLRTSTTFSGPVTPSTTGYYALYPWQNLTSGYGLINYDTADDVPETLHLEWCGYNQEATAFGFAPGKAYMMAYTSPGTDSFAFKQVFAYVKLKVTFDCDYVTLSGNDGETLGCQEIWLQMQGGVPTVVKTTLNRAGVKSVILRSKTVNASGKTYVPAGTYLIAVLPQTLSKGFTLTFKPTSMSSSVTKATSKSAALTRGGILDLGVFSTTDFTGFPSTGEWEGAGTSSSPYLITTVAQWNLLAERMNSKRDTYLKYYDKYYKLTENLDFKGGVAACVGNEMSRSFEGVFDGGGHTISDYYPATGDGVEALFGYVKSATIQGLTVKPAGFKGRYEGFNEFVYSPLIGVTTVDSDKDNRATTIENCHVEPLSDNGAVLNMGCYEMDCTYGSIVAWIRDRVYIMRCSSSLSICLSSTSDTGNLLCAGGIAGKVYDCNIANVRCLFDRCRNTGNIEVQSYGEGIGAGILGYDYDQLLHDIILRMSNCENRGTIKLEGNGWNKDKYQYAGGLLGKHDSDGSVTTGDPFVYNSLNAGQLICNCHFVGCAGGLSADCYDDDTVFCNCIGLWRPTGNADTHLFSYLNGGGYVGKLVNSYAFDYTFGEDDLKDMSILNNYRTSIPDHPDKAVVFHDIEDNKLYQYCYWNGNVNDRTLSLNF